MRNLMKRKGQAMTQESLSKLVELAKTVRVTDEMKEDHRRSFVYGNTAIENKRITRELVDQIAESTKNE